MYIEFTWFVLVDDVSFTYRVAVDEDMLMALAHQDYKAGNFNQALENSKAVYQRNPSRTDNLLLLGAVHYQVIGFLFVICCIVIKQFSHN